MFKKMFLINQWLWFHILSAIGIFMLAFLHAFKVKDMMIEPSAHYACIWVVSFIFGWEIVEFIWAKYIKKNLLATYGTAKNWFYDTVGDIIGGLIAMIMMVYFVMLLF